MIKAVPKVQRADHKVKADRCAGCGHPNKEHRQDECTVPHCKCEGRQ